MPSDIPALRSQLCSPDVQARSWAAICAGNYGAEAAELLPLLLEMMQHKLTDSRPTFPCGEFVSVGRILRSADRQIAVGAGSSQLAQQWEATLERILALLELARGPSAQLLVYTLALAGPPAASAAPVIARIAAGSQDRVMHKRAYQFAYAVQPELLTEYPWNALIGSAEAERAKNELDSARTAYND